MVVIFLRAIIINVGFKVLFNTFPLISNSNTDYVSKGNFSNFPLALSNSAKSYEVIYQQLWLKIHFYVL